MIPTTTTRTYTLPPLKLSIKELKQIQKKEKNRRVITQNKKKWIFTEDELYNDDTQYHILGDMVLSSSPKVSIPTAHQYINEHISLKLQGYKSQDIRKNIYCDTTFMTKEIILQKCWDCEMKCFYCKKPVLLIYEYVREPRQWTLERIDNSIGHTHSNCEISCLSCNLRRRTMYHERYIATQQMKIILKMDAVEPFP